MIINRKKIAIDRLSAQSLLEYVVFIVLFVFALLASQTYIKRAMQGRWKEAADRIGEQYDYQATYADINLTTESNAISNSTLVRDAATGKGWINREDLVNAVEKRTGNELIGGY